MKAFHKGDFPKASELLKIFLDKDPTEAEVVDRARIYLDICNNRLKEEKIVLKTTDDYFQYGVFKLNEGDHDEALKALEKAHEKEPKQGKILYLMANVFLLKGDIDRCLAFLKQAFDLDKFYVILAQNEVDFEDLRGDERFKLITKVT